MENPAQPQIFSDVLSRLIYYQQQDLYKKNLPPDDPDTPSTETSIELKSIFMERINRSDSWLPSQGMKYRSSVLADILVGWGERIVIYSH